MNWLATRKDKNSRDADGIVSAALPALLCFGVVSLSLLFPSGVTRITGLISGSAFSNHEGSCSQEAGDSELREAVPLVNLQRVHRLARAYRVYTDTFAPTASDRILHLLTARNYNLIASATEPSYLKDAHLPASVKL